MKTNILLNQAGKLLIFQKDSNLFTKGQEGAIFKITGRVVLQKMSNEHCTKF